MLTKQLTMPQLPRFLERWLTDPPPQWVVAFSGQGIVRAATTEPLDLRVEPLPAGALVPSPVDANFRDHEQIQKALRAILPASSSGRDTPCAMVLPDYSVRVSVLDFDEFPASHEEQEPLVRFRLRKVVPYDLDSAKLSFHAKRLKTGAFAVVAAVCPIHILAEYETLMRQQRCHAGMVTSSTLAAISLVPPDGISVLAKQSGNVTTVAVCQEGTVRMVRTVEMFEVSWNELLGLLHPTFATVEDNLGSRVDRLWICGFQDSPDAMVESLQQEFGVPVAPLTSRFGTPTALTTGTLGYVQGILEVSA
jgi:type IV pilus assembly protein PilM